MVAIVSKAVYQRDMPQARVGDVVPLDAYLSTNTALQKLAGGRLFLLTVRPPGEALWLVAVLVNPRFEGTKWVADRNTTPVRDVSALRPVLEFENGKGLPSEPGKLGMSLQTPRVLTAEDANALLGAAPSAPPPARKLINLTQHVFNKKEPCLCAKCLPAAPREFELEGEKFLRRSVVVKRRELFFWAPAALADSPAMAKSVASAMRRVRDCHQRAAPAAVPREATPVPAPVIVVAAADPPTARKGGVVGFLKSLIGK
jgi:hypothetical protein